MEKYLASAEDKHLPW